MALLLFGKVGTLLKPSSWTEADGGEAEVVQTAHASLRRYVLEANPRSRIDAFAHSWNPKLGGVINRLYRPGNVCCLL